MAQALSDQGESDPSQVLQMSILHRLSAQQQHELDRLLAEQQTPGSANYHQWLTAEEYGDRFGFTDAETRQVRSWLHTVGMKTVIGSKSKASISFSAAIPEVEAAFGTKIHRFAATGKRHFANITEPTLPDSLAKLISAIHGLNDFTLEHHRAPVFAFPETSFRGLAPDDLATIYNIQTLYDSGLNGEGVSIGIVGAGEIDPNVVRQYRSRFNLPAKDLEIKTVPGTAGTLGLEYDLEGYLDVEIAGAIARNANIIYIRSGNPDTALQYAIENNVAPVLSYSFAGCAIEATMRSFYEPLFKQANSQGITIVAGSGDSGAAGCDSPSATVAVKGLSVMAPASSPQVTAVGGTMFTDVSSSKYWGTTNNPHGGDAISYIPEQTWNDGNHLYATGGGKSREYSKPAWQSGTGVPMDGQRDVPDLAMSASPTTPYLICTSLNCDVSLQGVGGTSGSTPLFAGILVLLNQQLVRQGTMATPGLGNINPHLYLLAVKGSSAFHDITSGSNVVPCTIGTTDCTSGSFGYIAGPGYDQATGLGSVDAQKLVNLWTSADPTISSVSVGSTATEVSVGDAVVLTAKVSTNDGSIPTGNVSFLATVEGGAAKLLGVGHLDSLGNAVLSTSQLTGGSDAISVDYEGDLYRASSFSSNKVMILVQKFTTSLAASVSTATVECGNPITMSILVTTSASDHIPAGLVSIMDGGATIASGSLDSSGSLVIVLDSLSEGSHVLNVNYAGGEQFAPSFAIQKVLVTPQPGAINTSILFTLTPTILQSGAEVAMKATVTQSNGAPLSTGQVTFSDGTIRKLDKSGIATSTVSLSSPSAQTIAMSAVYSGSKGFRSSVSNVVEVTLLSPIVMVPTITTLAVSSSSVTMADDVTFVAKVTTADSSIPVGLVNLSNGASALLDASGTATITVHAASALRVGDNSVFAGYRGSDANSGSQSHAVTVVLLKPDFILTGPATVTVVKGQNSTATITITPINGFTGQVRLGCNGPVLQCSLSQPLVDVSQGVSNIAITITNGASAAFLFTFLALAGLSRPKRLVAGTILSLICMANIGGCGSNAGSPNAVPGPPAPKQSTMYVTATANGISRTISVVVTQQ